MEQNRGFLVGHGFMSQDGDVAVGMETVDHPGAGSDSRAEAFITNGHATIGAYFQRGTGTPDVRPPGATGCRTQGRAIFLASFLGSGIGRAAQFTMDFLGVAMLTQLGQEDVGRFRCSNIFGSEQRRQAALPVLVLAFDFAFGLRGAGVAQGDAVEVQRGSELSQGFGSLGKEKAVAIHIKFQRQSMLGEGGGEEVEVSQEVFGVINFGAGANAGTVIQQIEQRIVSFVAWEPTVRRGIQLPERTDLETLPAADGSGWAAWRRGVGQMVGEGPPADGGRVDWKAQTAMNFGGRKAIRSRWTDRKEFANECFSALRPVRGVIPT